MKPSYVQTQWQDLAAIEKMLQLELIDVETAREMESMTPYGNGEANDINL
jgi:hypothetical protein